MTIWSGCNRSDRRPYMKGQETPHRVERDSMGEVKVPRDALFGAQTRRALENFTVSDLRFQRRFIQALGALKLEAAVVNNDFFFIDTETTEIYTLSPHDAA